MFACSHFDNSFPVSPKEEAIRGQLYAGTDVITGHGVGLSGASLSVLNMLPYIHAFDTKTGMPYVCDPDKKKPDEKIDNRWKMIVPPCPDFKKCLFPWNEGWWRSLLKFRGRLFVARLA